MQAGENLSDANASKQPTRSPPITKVDLEREVRVLRSHPRRDGRTGKTLARGLNARIVLTVLDRGSRVAEHHAKEATTIHVLDGRVIVALLAASFDLSAGELLTVDRDTPHAIVAVEDSALVLTISRPRWSR